MSWFLRDYIHDPLFFGRVFDPVTLGTSLAIGAASAGGSYALSKTIKPPTPPPVQPTPDIFNEQAKAKAEAEKKRLAALPGSSRESTILSGPSGTGGSDGRTSYSGTVLGT